MHDVIDTLCIDCHALELLSALHKIATPAQREEFDKCNPRLKHEDVIDALERITKSVNKASPPTKIEKWVSKLRGVVAKLAPIIDPLAQSTSPGSAAWSSIKVFLEVPNPYVDPC